jgi:hypothetical protein
MRMVARSTLMHKHTVGPLPAGWVTVTATQREGS